MTTEVNHHIGLEGIFNFKLTNTKTGEIREYEFKNLILNSGIDYYMTSSNSFISGCILGSSSVPPVATDTTITNILGTSTTYQTGGAGGSNTTVLPYYTSYYWTYRFIEGVATGNIAQVAIPYGSVSAANNTYTGLFSKALVKDGNGTPITITKLADEVLDVTYTLRMYAPELDVTGTTTISGVNYDYIVRAANAGSWSLSVGAASSVYYAEAYTGTIGTQLGTPSGSAGVAATKTFATYVVGTHTRTATIFWDLNNGNLSGGIRSVYLLFGNNSYGAGIRFQIQYTANPAHPDTTVTIPKDATKKTYIKIPVYSRQSVMLPDNTLASVQQFSEWKYAYPLTNSATVSYEWGGVALTDTTQGHDAFLWKLEYISGGLYLGKVGDTATLQLTIGQGISRTALAFDSNMRPMYAWQSGLETCVLYYYDTSLNDFTQVTFEGIYSPCLTLDDNRPQSSSISDIIFAYLKGDQLCYRQQRDRFLTEYVLATVEQKHLVRVGMNKKHRLQFMLKTALPVQ